MSGWREPYTVPRPLFHRPAKAEIIISLSSALQKPEKLRTSDTPACPPTNEPLSDIIIMGSWGVLPFENDDALDWVWELEDAENFAVLELALEDVALAEAEDYVEAPAAEEALAAAEVVAALLGKPLEDLPEPVEAFLEQNRGKKPNADLIDLAVKAVKRVKKSSELKELWEASDDAEKWDEAVDDLLSRLK